MAQQELSKEARAEELTPEQILNLCHAVLELLPEGHEIL